MSDGLDLLNIHLQALGRENVAEELDRLLIEKALRQLAVQAMCSQATKYLSDMFSMVGWIIRIDENIVQVDHDAHVEEIGQPGKMRASYRDSLTKPSLLKPGRVVAALLRPWDSAHELRPGHRLGLLVNSSMFPIYARNLGTGEALATGKRMIPQRNAILTGIVTPSRITFRRLW